MPSAIVTGGCQGIGRAIALRLAEDGFDVAVNDIKGKSVEVDSVVNEINARGRRAISTLGDVSNEEDVRRIVDDTVSAFGELNVMVANAGIIATKRIFELTVEEWDKVQAINVRGVFLCYRAAGQQMIAQGKGGKIIGACSISGYKPQPTAVAYSVSKWAVRGLTQAVAQEFGPHRINVNAYCPGIVSTPMWDQIDAKYSAINGWPKGRALEESVKARSAMGKAQTPEDIAGAVSFLASKDSDLITGQSIIIDGGKRNMMTATLVATQ